MYGLLKWITNTDYGHFLDKGQESGLFLCPIIITYKTSLHGWIDQGVVFVSMPLFFQELRECFAVPHVVHWQFGRPLCIAVSRLNCIIAQMDGLVARVESERAWTKPKKDNYCIYTLLIIAILHFRSLAYLGTFGLMVSDR